MQIATIAQMMVMGCPHSAPFFEFVQPIIAPIAAINNEKIQWIIVKLNIFIPKEVPAEKSIIELVNCLTELY